jgi:hypothetical protein
MTRICKNMIGEIFGLGWPAAFSFQGPGESIISGSRIIFEYVQDSCKIVVYVQDSTCIRAAYLHI